MTTITASRLYSIFPGTPVTVDDDLILLGVGPTGDATTRRRLVYPSIGGEPAVLEPIVYFTNPDRTANLDNELLLAPITNVLPALEGSRVTRFEQTTPDVVITETWTASDSKFSVPGFLWRALYQYLLNPPPFDPGNQTFITWEPRDRNAKAYNVELLRILVGGGPEGAYDVNEFLGKPGELDSLDEGFAAGAGLLDRPFVFQFKILSEVP